MGVRKMVQQVGLTSSTAAPTTVNVYGRKVQVPLASGTMCRFSFADLCEEVCRINRTTSQLADHSAAWASRLHHPRLDFPHLLHR